MPKVPQTLSDGPLCDALAHLHDAGRFAVCASPGSGDSIRIHFVHDGAGRDNFTQEIDAAASPVIETVVQGPQAPPPAGTSLPAVAGSAGLGAALAGLAKWLFDRFMKKRSQLGGSSLPSTHEAQDVHVTAGLRAPPKRRIRKAFGENA
ncbi:hypothetical protein [Paraburkholderia ribeironis]|nr:hypothetical protein [Paraburkholderia ribeironis]